MGNYLIHSLVGDNHGWPREQLSALDHVGGSANDRGHGTVLDSDDVLSGFPLALASRVCGAHTPNTFQGFFHVTREGSSSPAVSPTEPHGVPS